MTRPIRVGHIDVSFHDAAAREVERILRARGHRIERSAAPHEEMFGRMGEGDVDVPVSAWLPEVADLLREPALERMERLIQGINPGAGISRFSAAMVVEYGLGAAGYEFRTGTEA